MQVLVCFSLSLCTAYSQCNVLTCKSDPPLFTSVITKLHLAPFLFLFPLLFICPVITSWFFTNHMMWEGKFLWFCAAVCEEFLLLCHMPHAVLCEEFLLYALCYFMWGLCLICLVLLYMESFSYMLCTVLGGKSVLYCLCYFNLGLCLTCLVLFYVGSSSYMPDALLCREFLLHAVCYFMWGVSLIKLQALCYFMWGIYVSITHCVLCGNFVNFYMLCAVLYW